MRTPKIDGGSSEAYGDLIVEAAKESAFRGLTKGEPLGGVPLPKSGEGTAVDFFPPDFGGTHGPTLGATCEFIMIFLRDTSLAGTASFPWTIFLNQCKN